MKIQQTCFCGCSSFYLYLDPAQKNRISFECQSCHCRRGIWTPGVSVAAYKLGPATVDVGVPSDKAIEGLLESEAAEERAAKLYAQLPEGMKNCTIVYVECHKGHGRLTATNWVEHGCPQCEIERLRCAKK